MNDRWINVGLVIASVLLTYVGAEVGARVYRHDFHFKNRLEALNNLFRSTYPAAYDPILGWVPKADFASSDNVWHTAVTILGNSTRSNGFEASHDVSTSTVLAVGDSYTFGDEVSNQETWPALLEQRIHGRVVNGGVFGYGVDQSTLRALDLEKRVAPNLIIFQLIASDIQRTELSQRTGVKKPYFVIHGNDLTLQGVPVPPLESYEQRHSVKTLKELASYSLLFHGLMLETFPRWWTNGRWENIKVQNDGDAVSCALVVKLKEETAKAGVGLLILLQYTQAEVENPSSLSRIRRLKSCLAPHYVLILDLLEYLRAVRACEPNRFDRLYSPLIGHMTLAGNTLIAEILKFSVPTLLKVPAEPDQITKVAAGIAEGELAARRKVTACKAK
jgi:hypothetical protein